MTVEPDPASLPEYLQRAARSCPDRIAVQQATRTITYATLAARVAGFAERLRELGFKPGDRLAVVLPNSIEYVVHLYGALLAGAVVVPLNAGAKSAELATLLMHCEPAVIVCERSNSEVVSAVEKLSFRPRLLEPVDAGAMPDVPWPALAVTRAEDVACIVYTSGTTGRPKGVALTHRNLTANNAAIAEYLGLSSLDVSVVVLPFHYAYGSSVLHSHLIAGARLVIEQNLVYPHAIAETLARERATGFAGVPSTYALLLSRVDLRKYDLAALRYLTQAGGGMSSALIQRLRDALPATDLFIMYGQTEATARLTFLPPAQLSTKLGSVGIPVREVSIQVRDEAGRPVPAEQVGEIWARGPNVMQGYWRDADATSQVLRDGWLKTGDMGRLDEDGFLFIAGRRSDMIKVGAHRVHPQEVEEVIAELPQVQEVAVTGVDDEMLGQTIQAHVVLASSALLSPMHVQAHCRERLANYKIPKSVVFVASLPRTASGKVRRRELTPAKRP